MNDTYKKLTVSYAGEDDNYWEQVKEFYENNFSVPKSFVHLVPETGENIQTLFPSIIELPIRILYIELSKNTEEALQLVRICKRSNVLPNLIVVGLLDMGVDTNTIERAILTNADFIHIKGPDLHDVVFHPMTLFNQNLLNEPEFATGKMEDQVFAFELARVNSVSFSEMVIEYNRNLALGYQFDIKTSFLHDKLPSSKVTVRNISESDHYYDHRYRIHLKFQYIEKEQFLTPTKPGEEVPSSQEQLLAIQKDFYQWIEEQVEISKPKFTKILVVNKDFNQFNESTPGIDKLDFVIRHQSVILNAFEEINALRPNIITFRIDYLESEDEESESEETSEANPEESPSPSGDQEEQKQKDESKEGEEGEQSEEDDKNQYKKRLFGFDNITEKIKEKIDVFSKKEEEKAPEVQILDPDFQNEILSTRTNDLEALKEIARGIRLIDDDKYNPIILAFNVKGYDTKSLKDELGHSNTMAFEKDFDIKMITDMATKFDQKIRQSKLKVPKLKFGDAIVPNYTIYYNKTQPQSIAEIDYPITMLTIREHEITFRCDFEIQLGDTFKVDHPVDYYITVVPHSKKTKQNAGPDTYRGLIHGVNEEGKEKLRVFINSVFFRRKEKFEQKEKEMLDAKGKAYLARKEKEEAAKAALENPKPKAATGNDLDDSFLAAPANQESGDSDQTEQSPDGVVEDSPFGKIDEGDGN